MNLRLCSIPLLVSAATAPAQEAHPKYFQDLSDISLYLKPRFTTPNTWDQQLGLRARLVRYGNFSAEYSIAYDPTYPIKFDVRPRWTTGIQLAYYPWKTPFPIGFYTTPKHNLYSTWKQEFGVNFRFVNTPRYYVNSSLDYQATYPYVKKGKPGLQASLTLGFPF